jgi:hypothetical protein
VLTLAAEPLHAALHYVQQVVQPRVLHVELLPGVALRGDAAVEVLDGLALRYVVKDVPTRV